MLKKKEILKFTKIFKTKWMKNAASEAETKFVSWNHVTPVCGCQVSGLREKTDERFNLKMILIKTRSTFIWQKVSKEHVQK